MKHWLLVSVSLGLAVLGDMPAWARTPVHGRGPAGGVQGFARGSSVGVPAMRPPAAPSATVVPRELGPAAARATTAPAPVRTPAVQPKMIVIDPSGRAQTLASSGSVTTGRSVLWPTDPTVIVVSRPATARAVGPQIIEVVPSTTVSRPLSPKVIVISSPVIAHPVRSKVILSGRFAHRRPLFFLGQPSGVGVIPVIPMEPFAPVDSAALLVEAAPEEAQVFLDGQLLGAAGELSGLPVTIPAGLHWLEIVSPGAEPFSVQFTATPGVPTRIHVALATR